MPKSYSVVWECNDCGKESTIGWDFSVHGIWEKRKAPKMRKRRKEEKKRRKEVEAEYDSDTQRNGGYRNDKVKHKI